MALTGYTYTERLALYSDDFIRSPRLTHLTHNPNSALLRQFIDGIKSGQGVPLTKFRIFRRLPLELRNKIWRATLPMGTEVDIGTSSYLEPSDPTRSGSRHSLPVALRVTRESRTEALLHYFFFPRSQKGDRNVYPFLFDPKLDTALIKLQVAVNPKNNLLSEEFWLGRLGNEALVKCVSFITELTVLECDIFPTYFDTSLLTRDHHHHSEDTDGSYCCVFRYLPALKLVKLISRPLVHTGLHKPDVRNQFRAEVKGMLEAHRDVFTSEKLPKVVLDRGRLFATETDPE